MSGIKTEGSSDRRSRSSSTFTIASQPTASTQAVVAVALDSQVSPARLYMAHADGVWVLAGDDGSLIEFIGPRTSGLGAQLASGSGLESSAWPWIPVTGSSMSLRDSSMPPVMACGAR